MQPNYLSQPQAYQTWRAFKLSNYPKEVGLLIVNINNPIKILDEECNLLLKICAKTNIVIYRTNNDQTDVKHSISALTQQLGLKELDANICADEDRISTIQDLGSDRASYIPYTNKPLNWHTDGYYNGDTQRIRAFLMHCVRPAESGGENAYLDPEIAYILLRDENPNYIDALMDASVMTIPANEQGGRQIRAAQTGPVFFVDEESQSISMRYTARKRSIIWKNDKTVEHALAFLHEILQGNPYLFRYRLSAGEGVISNNVLHNRSAITDSSSADEKRLLYRARFYNRVKKCDEEQDLQDVVNQ